MQKTSKNIKRLLPFALAGALMLMGMGCGEEIESFEENVSVELNLKNENGQSTDEFDFGSDIIFELILKNNQNHDLSIFEIKSSENGIFSFNQIESFGNESTTLLSDLSPIDGVFQISYQLGYGFNTNSKLTFQSSWLANQKFMISPFGWRIDTKENQILPKGKYQFNFEIQLKFKDSESKNFKFNKIFTVI